VRRRTLRDMDDLLPRNPDSECACQKRFRCHADPLCVEANSFFQVGIDPVRDPPAAELIPASAKPVAPIGEKCVPLPPLRQIYRPGNVRMMLEAEDSIVVTHFE